MPEPSAPLCHRCRRRLALVPPEDVAARIARLPAASALDSCHALWAFDAGGTVQRVQHALKYGNRPRYGTVLGRWMAEPPGPAEVDLVVPVPLHRVRLYERGYNQSAYLAQGYAQAASLPTAAGLLRRTRATRSQTHLDRTARWANVDGAFAVTAPQSVDGRQILLIDDVLTTGATLAAAAQTLRSAGATAVHAATLALASA